MKEIRTDEIRHMLSALRKALEKGFPEPPAQPHVPVVPTVPGGDSRVEDIIRRAGVSARHEVQVEAARWIARGAARALFPEIGDDHIRAVVAALLLGLEAIGAYGGGWSGPGAGAARLGPFRRCGSGRRDAQDGLAWTAAIRAAWAESAQELAWILGKGSPWAAVSWDEPESWLLRLLRQLYWRESEALAAVIAAAGDGAIARRLLRHLEMQRTRAGASIPEGVALRLARALASVRSREEPAEAAREA